MQLPKAMVGLDHRLQVYSFLIDSGHDVPFPRVHILTNATQFLRLIPDQRLIQLGRGNLPEECPLCMLITHQPLLSLSRTKSHEQTVFVFNFASPPTASVQLDPVAMDVLLLAEVIHLSDGLFSNILKQTPTCQLCFYH